MLFLNLFILLFAICCGDLRCVVQEDYTCSQTILPPNSTFYKRTLQFKRCLEEGTRKCEVEHRMVVKNLLAALSEVSTEGTELNNELMHNGCVIDFLPHLISCFKDQKDAVAKVPTSTDLKEYKGNTFLMECRYNEQIEKCSHDKVFEKCGEKATRFYHKVFDPLFSLNNQACFEYIDSGSNTGTQLPYLQLTTSADNSRKQLSLPQPTTSAANSSCQRMVTSCLVHVFTLFLSLVWFNFCH